MKRMLVVAAVILAVGIPVAITASRHRAAENQVSAVKTTGVRNPVREPASAVSTPKDTTSAPHAKATKAVGHAATKAQKPISKPAPRVEAKRTPAKPAKTAPTVVIPEPTANAPETPEPVATQIVSAVCPVMRSRIADVSKAAGHSEYNGKTYYFCCAGCKPVFDKDPGKYAN